MMEGKPPFLDVTVNADKFEEGALQVLKGIRPGWHKDNIGFNYFTDGITNKLVGCFQKSQPDDVVLIRVNGECTELIIDRKAEVETFRLLSAADCSPPIFAQFCNGMAYGYFPGKPLDESMVRDDHIAPLITKELVRLHSVQPDHQDPASRRSFYPTKTRSYLDIIPTSFDDRRKQEVFVRDIPSKAALQQELEEIVHQLQALNMPVVFSHNDLLLKNIIYERDKDEVHFIDYEYAFVNYQAYDIGNHFCEYAGMEEVNYDLYPDKEYQVKWLRRYLQFWNRAQGGGEEEVKDTDIERLYVQTNKCACAAHFFWGVWALIQAQNSSIDFDFIQYSALRLNEYFRRKKEFFPLTSP